MFTRLRKPKHDSSGDSSNRQHKQPDRLIDAGISDDLLNRTNSNGLDKQEFTKSTDDQQNLINLNSTKEYETRLNEQFNRRLPSDHLDEENEFDFLDQIRGQASNVTNDTDNDSVQILDECDDRESVRVLVDNTDSDSILSDDKTKNDNQEIDNASVIALSSSNDGSSNDLLNHPDFDTNDEDSMSIMLMNVSPNVSPGNTVNNALSESDRRTSLEDFIRSINGNNQQNSSVLPRIGAMSELDATGDIDYGADYCNRLMDQTMTSMQTDQNMLNYYQRQNNRTRSNNRHYGSRNARPSWHSWSDRHHYESNDTNNSSSNSNAPFNRNHRSHVRPNYNNYSNSRNSPFQLNISEQAAHQPYDRSSLFNFMLNDSSNSNNNNGMNGNNPSYYSTCPFSRQSQNHQSPCNSHLQTPLYRTFSSNSQSSQQSQSQSNPPPTSNRRQNTFRSNSSNFVAPPLSLPFNPINNELMNMNQTHYPVNNNHQQQVPQAQSQSRSQTRSQSRSQARAQARSYVQSRLQLPTQNPLMTIQHRPHPGQQSFQPPVQSSFTGAYLLPNNSALAPENNRQSNIVFHQPNTNPRSRLPFPSVPQPPISLLSMFNQNSSSNNYRPSLMRNYLNQHLPTSSLLEFQSNSDSNQNSSSHGRSRIENQFMRIIDGMFNHGADRSTIRSFTTESKYKKQTKDKSVSDNITKEEEDEKCAICWSEFDENEYVRRLGCFHFFHRECVDKWLEMNKTCPVCREDITRSFDLSASSRNAQ